MAQILFGSNASPTLPNLDLNFADVYDLRELVKSSSYASPSAQKFDATSGKWVLTSAQGLGYATGAGGTVTQITSKATGVTLNKPAGQIVTHNASLASGASVAFGVGNSLVAATDVVILNLQDAGGGAHSLLDYQIWVAVPPSGGGFTVAIKNTNVSAIAEVLTLNFAIIKAVTS